MSNNPFPSNPLPLTYADLVCVEDCDPLARETTSDLENLEQDVLHVLLEDLGSNLDDPDRGVGIMNYLSGKIDDFNGLPGIIKTQLSRDPRIDTVDAQIVSQSDPTFPYVVRIQIGVNGTVVPLQYGWSLTGGLVPLAQS